MPNDWGPSAMNEQNHISTSQMIAWAAGEVSPDASAGVLVHLSKCTDCAAQVAALEHFNATLNAAWHAERLIAMGVAHPTAAELEMYWMKEEGITMATVGDHVAECESCTQQRDRLDEGWAAINSLDPLSSPQWSRTVSRQFAAGIEMVVEAAHGAFTSAAGLVREVMTPQVTTKLTPTPILAMGAGDTQGSSAMWHDATFQTDEVSGEVSGSTDQSTGRGVITIVVNKSGGFVAAPPVVDLVNASGTVVATQGALDSGDRYTASFSALDEGHYLVGIREPGT